MTRENIQPNIAIMIMNYLWWFVLCAESSFSFSLVFNGHVCGIGLTGQCWRLQLLHAYTAFVEELLVGGLNQNSLTDCVPRVTGVEVARILLDVAGQRMVEQRAADLLGSLRSVCYVCCFLRQLLQSCLWTKQNLQGAQMRIFSQRWNRVLTRRAILKAQWRRDRIRTLPCTVLWMINCCTGVVSRTMGTGWVWRRTWCREGTEVTVSNDYG